jgi:phage shock protein PspC (stress-responsive transcriptional regulator)
LNRRKRDKNMNGKRLYKSNNKKICGVCAGIAEYFDIDPTLVRLLWAAITLAGGCGIIIYIVAALVMDDDPSGIVN